MTPSAALGTGAPVEVLPGVPLVCPRCRAAHAGHVSVHALALASGALDGDGVLACTNTACGRRYPVLAGVPIVFANPAAWTKTEAAVALARRAPVETLDALFATLADDEPSQRSRELVSTYTASHWSAGADPLSLLPPGWWEAAGRIPRVVELGCGAGRVALEHARRGAHALGVDVSAPLLFTPSELARTGTTAFDRRVAGRRYTREAIAVLALKTDRARFLCADALDPPLPPACAEAVVALNVLDNVPVPANLLAQADALLVPGGLLALSSPYAWRSGIVEEGERLEGGVLPADPADALVAVLKGALGERLPLDYEILHDARRVPWRLERDARSAMTFEVHVVLARKRR